MGMLFPARCLKMEQTLPIKSHYKHWRTVGKPWALLQDSFMILTDRALQLLLSLGSVTCTWKLLKTVLLPVRHMHHIALLVYKHNYFFPLLASSRVL